MNAEPKDFFIGLIISVAIILIVFFSLSFHNKADIITMKIDDKVTCYKLEEQFVSYFSCIKNKE